MTVKPVQLSKSRYLAGLQCQKRLYLECFHYDKRDPIEDAAQSRFDAGNMIGELAREKFQYGVLIAQDHFEHEEAAEATKSLMADASIPAFFEAGFTYDDIKARLDILVRRPDNKNSFDMFEVKSTTRLKAEHIPDIAVQYYVATGAGLAIERCYLLCINNAYVYPGGAYDLSELFLQEDITEQILEYQKIIPGMLTKLKAVLASEQIPDVAIGKHCTQPYDCTYYNYCHTAMPDDHIMNLPGLRDKLRQKLLEHNIERIKDIPEDFDGLSVKQIRALKAIKEDKLVTSQDVQTIIKKLSYPIYFIDFETMNSAAPLVKGTRPYQQVTLQWSAHILRNADVMEHQEYLATISDDPRREFMESLIKALGDDGPILVYSKFEKQCLQALAKEYPQYHPDLNAICDRMVDLCKLLQEHTYHPKYKGSFSIKNVLPALVPTLSYAGLGINNGGAASAAFVQMFAGKLEPETMAKMRGDLLAYCKLDTLAMVEVYRVLKS